VSSSVDIRDIAKASDGPALLNGGTVMVKVGDLSVAVRVRQVKTPIGCSMWLLVCPLCRRQCRQLHAMPDRQLGCKDCAHVRHPDQRLPDSESGRMQKLAHQIQRLDARLAQRGLDRTPRRRMRRRKRRLLAQLAAILKKRRSRLHARVDGALVAPPVATVAGERHEAYPKHSACSGRRGVRM
jgi:hypothetical protein